MSEQHYLFGYYGDPSSDKPTYDPGTAVPCLFCQKKLQSPMKTISLMKDGDVRSYFYRVHKECYETTSEQEVTLYESALIDNIT